MVFDGFDGISFSSRIVSREREEKRPATLACFSLKKDKGIF